MVKMAKMAINARKNFAARQGRVPEGGAEERTVPTGAGDTRVLLYRPAGGPAEALPIFVSMHGGGFVMGSAEDDDKWCRRIADGAGCLVVNVDYRLSPEHKFPVALEECYDVVRWVRGDAAALGADPARIAVGGFSAGGNLAAALCLLAKERGEFSLVFQVLNYPPLDLTIDPYKDPPTADKLLTPKTRDFFTACYYNTPADIYKPLVSPLLAGDLGGLPAALVISAEYDPLRPEQGRYAARLEAAGVDTAYRVFAGCYHAFTHFGAPAAAEEAGRLMVDKLRGAFAKSK